MERTPEQEDARTPLKVGQNVYALSGPVQGRPHGRFIVIESVFTGPDGTTWVRGTWPGTDTDAERDMNGQLEANGLTVDPAAHTVEGPADKFLS